MGVPCPAGTLILFDATLPHGTKPNISTRSRAILFLRYITSDELPSAAWMKRNAALNGWLRKLDSSPHSSRPSICLASDKKGKAFVWPRHGLDTRKSPQRHDL